MTSTQAMRAILHYAAEHDLDSAVLVQALAETLAVTAVTLDAHAAPISIDDRLKTFCDHVLAAYHHRTVERYASIARGAT